MWILYCWCMICAHPPSSILCYVVITGRSLSSACCFVFRLCFGPIAELLCGCAAVVFTAEVGEVILILSNDRGFGDVMAVALAQGVGELLARRPELRGALTELWLHHTTIGDGGLGSPGAGGTALASVLISCTLFPNSP